jgi:hypothetical protein
MNLVYTNLVGFCGEGTDLLQDLYLHRTAQNTSETQARVAIQFELTIPMIEGQKQNTPQATTVIGIPTHRQGYTIENTDIFKASSSSSSSSSSFFFFFCFEEVTGGGLIKSFACLMW